MQGKRAVPKTMLHAALRKGTVETAEERELGLSLSMLAL